MNMIPTGAFLTEMDASEKKETLAEQFVSIWEKKNSKIARAGGVSLMALSLAACGSSSSDTAATDTPAAETPAEETPAAETPAEETPAEETPVEVTPVTTALVADADATGTAGADTFTATTATTTAATTLVGTNDISGGEGADVLQLSMDANFGGFTVSGSDTGSMTGIETVELTNAGSIARTFDATGVSGVETYKIDGTNGIVNITDSADLAAIELSNIASGAFSITYAAPTGGTSPVAGTADTLSLTVEGMGSATADISVTAAGVETLAVTSNAAATAAGATNYLDLSGVSAATAVTVAGAADTDVAAVAATTTSFDASAATGAVTAVLSNAAADALATIKTGSGDDSVTAVVTDMPVNATIDMGAGDDTLTLSGVGETTQYAMSGVETLDLTDVTGASSLFSMSKATEAPSTIQLGEAGAATPNPSAGTHEFVGDSGDKTINIVGDSTGGLTTDTSGAITVNVSADSKATTANGGDTAAATVTANSASALTIDVSGAVAQSGAITAGKATTVTANLGGTVAQTAKISAAKAETVSITDTKGATLHADSVFTAANTISIENSGGTFTNAEVFPAAASVTLTGTGSKAAWDGNALIGSATLANNLTVTATGYDSGFNQDGGGINSGDGDLTVNLDGILEGNIDTGDLTSGGTLTVSADTLGTFELGGTNTAKSVVIDAADVLGALTYGNIVATSGVTIDGSTLKVNQVTVDASATSTALTVDFDGGNGIDTLDIDTGAKTKTVTVTGDLGNARDTIAVDVAAYTADATSTVTIDVSGVVADTTNQTAITIETDAELNNDLTITGSKGTADEIDLGTSKTYTGDFTISGIETVSFNSAVGLTAASLSGVETVLSADAANKVATLTGTANDDTLTYADIDNTSSSSANTPTLTINAGNGDDTVTGSDGADTINGEGGEDTITGGKGADTIDGGAAADTIVYTKTTDGATAVTLTDITGAADDFSATAGTHTDSTAFVTATDKIKIDGTLEGLLEAEAAIDISSTTANLDYDAIGIFVIAAAQANLDADNFGDVSDIATNFNIGNGTVANETIGDEILFTLENNSANATGLYYFKDEDGDGNISDGDTLALLTIIGDASLVAADFTV